MEKGLNKIWPRYFWQAIKTVFGLFSLQVYSFVEDN
jgi:hypothetical protein